MTIINVLTNRLNEAEAELIKIVRKAQSRGLPFSYKILDSFAENRIKTIDGKEISYKVGVTPIEIIGTLPVIGDYEFISKVEMTDVGPIFMTVPEKQVPNNFYGTNNRCDHCNISRKRNTVFIIRNNVTDEYMQVGSSCLKEFLQVEPSYILNRFNFIKKFKDYENEWSYGGPRIPIWGGNIIDILAYTAASIKACGWKSRTIANEEGSIATADIIGHLFSDGRTGPSDSLKQKIKKTEEAYDNMDAEKIAEEAYEWLKQQTPNNDFMINLKTICQKDYLDNPRFLGILVAGMYIYQREMQLLEQKKEDKNSSYIGNLKERITVEVVLESSRMISSYYGDSILYKFRDMNGNILCWFSSSGSLDKEIGDKFFITGTVKKHEEFKGIKQTMLTRVKEN